MGPVPGRTGPILSTHRHGPRAFFADRRERCGALFVVWTVMRGERFVRSLVAVSDYTSPVIP